MASSGEIPALYLLPLDSSFFPPKRIHLPPGTRVRVGRQLNPKSAPNVGNGVFESRVLSRQHAEVWVEDERMLIRDVKSSNGTFVNGERLSLEGAESDPYELRSDDILEFGIDIIGDHGEVVHRKVAARVTCAFTPAEAARAVRAEGMVVPPPAPAPTSIPPLPHLNHPGILDGAHPHGAGAGGSGGSGSGGLIGNGNGSGNGGGADRRPQHGTGLAGMGGMGAERIHPRPRGGADFDSVLARIRDEALGMGTGMGRGRPALPAAFAMGGIGAASASASARGGQAGAGVAAPIPPAAGSPPRPNATSISTSDANANAKAGVNTDAAKAGMNTEGVDAGANPDAADDAIAQLRAGLAETQAALAEAVRAAAAFQIASVSEAGSEASTSTGDSPPESESDPSHAPATSTSPSTPSITNSSTAYPPPPSSPPASPSSPSSSSSPAEPAPAPAPSPLHANALTLRAEIAALRAEAADVHVQRARRARAKTVTARATAAGVGAGVGGAGRERARSGTVTQRERARTVTQKAHVGDVGGTARPKRKGKGKGKGKQSVRELFMQPRHGVDLLEDLEIDEGARALQRGAEEDGDGDDDDDSDSDEEDGEYDGDGEPSAEKDEDGWADELDFDFGADVADMTPTLTPSRAAFARAQKDRAGLGGVFKGGEEEEDVEGWPAALSAMLPVASPTAGEREEEREGRQDGDEGGQGQKTRDEGAAPENLAALAAQLDALSIQLGTLHGRLRALQVASPVPFTSTENDNAEEEDDGKETGAGGRLDGLDARVRALEGAVASTSSSAPASTSMSASPAPSSLSLPTPDPSPSIPSHAPAALASSSSSTEAPVQAQDDTQNVESIQATLQAGLVALQAEWATFRTEVAAFPPPFPPPSPHASVAGGAPALRGAADAYVYASGSSTIARGSGIPSNTRGLWRRDVYGVDGEAEERASDTDTSSSLSDEPGSVGTPHLRAAVEADDEDARVPGRWGLLTPEGSVRGGQASSALLTATAAKAPPSPWLFNSTTPTGPGFPANGILGEALHAIQKPKQKGEPEPVKARRPRVDVEQTLLLLGAVGAGVMIVAAAWWGA